MRKVAIRKTCADCVRRPQLRKTQHNLPQLPRNTVALMRLRHAFHPNPALPFELKRQSGGLDELGGTGPFSHALVVRQLLAFHIEGSHCRVAPPPLVPSLWVLRPLRTNHHQATTARARRIGAPTRASRARLYRQFHSLPTSLPTPGKNLTACLSNHQSTSFEGDHHYLSPQTNTRPWQAGPQLHHGLAPPTKKNSRTSAQERQHVVMGRN